METIIRNVADLSDQTKLVVETLVGHELSVDEQLIIAIQPTRPAEPLPATETAQRPHALCVGLFSVPDDFDAPLPEDIVQEFEGR